MTIGTPVKAKMYDKENPKAMREGTIIDSEKYPCGMILYTVKLYNDKLIFRFENELVPL
jgi:hypothetical protein